MDDTKVLKAYCSKRDKYMVLVAKKIGSAWKIIDVNDVSDVLRLLIASEISKAEQPTFETNDNLLPCSRCNSRRVGGCACAKATCPSDKNKYNFQCVYCNELKIDYSLPDPDDLEAHKGEIITLPQGKKYSVVTFSNVAWTKFDNISYHPSGARYREPAVHVSANEKNIQFTGYNVSAMDEGVYYSIGAQDNFLIKCDVNTTTIQPHPGGYFYVKFGPITAQIDQNGGSFLIDGRTVATVGPRFNMKLSVNCGTFIVFVNNEQKGEIAKQLTDNIKVTFGFAHGSHDCHILSKATISNIQMMHGTSRR